MNPLLLQLHKLSGEYEHDDEEWKLPGILECTKQQSTRSNITTSMDTLDPSDDEDDIPLHELLKMVAQEKLPLEPVCYIYIIVVC
jgi:hypothetical protein